LIEPNMWLLIGGDSEIGTATHQFLKSRGIASAATTRRKDRVAADRPFLDLAAPLDGWEPPAGTTAACFFAAIARIAACDGDPQGSAHINVTQTLALADKLMARGISVLFVSTNQVFDGTVPNVPADAPHSPVTEYGRQKARTETELLARMEQGKPAAILRLAKIVSPDMPLLRGWIDTLAAGKPVRAFRDMTMAPAETVMVAEAIAALMKDGPRGTYQLTGPRDVSYADIGRYIAAQLGADPALVIDGSTADAGLPPGTSRMHTTLDSSLLRTRFGLVVPDALSVVETVIENAKAET
jgi:dTDP-4-dehydrorhamnose reductase